MFDINDVVSKITSEIQRCEELQLIQDIIMIYNNSYKNYIHYVNEINLSNERLDEYKRNINKNFNTTSFYYHPKHTLISENSYNFIINLSKLYDKSNLKRGDK